MSMRDSEGPAKRLRHAEDVRASSEPNSGSSTGPFYSSVRRLGFKEYEDMLSWQRANQAVLDEEGFPGIRSTLRNRLFLSSSYSGWGAAETVSPQIADAAGCPDGIVNYSASDLSELARRALASHGTRSQPLHLFDDILTRIDQASLDKMKYAHARIAKDMETRLDACASRGERFEVVTSVGRGFVRQARSILEEAKFPTHLFCHIHKDQCSVVPSTRGNALWVETAGITCTAFSNYGRRLRWADASAIVSLTWAWWVRAHRPDMVCIECVPQLEWEPIAKILDMYAHITDIIDPVAFGVPSRRRRSYGMFIIGPEHQNQMNTWVGMFEPIMYRTLEADGSIFLRAPPGMMLRVYQGFGAERGVGLEEIDMQYLKVQDVIESGNAARLRAYVDALQKSCEKLSLPRPEHVLVNVSQNEHHLSLPSIKNSCIFPTLMRRSLLVNIGNAYRNQRIVHHMEFFAAMLFPIFTDRPELCKYFPWGSVEHFQDLFTAYEIRAGAGNGMNLIQIGSWLQFMFSFWSTLPGNAEMSAVQGSSGESSGAVNSSAAASAAGESQKAAPPVLF